MPRKTRKYARAKARQKNRKPVQKRPHAMLWNIGIAVVIVLGVVGIIISKQSKSASSADTAPRASNSATNTTGGATLPQMQAVNAGTLIRLFFLPTVRSCVSSS